MRKRTPDTLLIVLGDQLDAKSSLIKELDREKDLVWMAEAKYEANRIWSHKARIVLFLSSMRHFRQMLEAAGYPVRYIELGDHPIADELRSLGLPDAAPLLSAWTEHMSGSFGASTKL